jgi:hypothetical protein
MSIDYKKIAEANNVTEEQVIQLEKQFKRFLYNQVIKSVGSGELIKIQMRGFGTIQVHEKTINHKLFRYLEVFRACKNNNQEYDKDKVKRFKLLWKYRHEKLKMYLADNRRNQKRNYLLRIPKK